MTTRSIQKICVVRFGGMGDILLATPALRVLSQTFDTRSIDFIVGPGMQDALTGIPYIRHVIPWNKKSEDARPGNFLRFVGALRRERYDLFLNFQPSTRSLLMAAGSGAGQVITFRKDRRRQPETGRVRHAIDDFTKELAPLGITVADRRMDFHVPLEAQVSLRDKLAHSGVTGPYIAINPAATRLINRWPPDRFALLIDRLAEQRPDLYCVVTGGPNETELAAEVLGGVRENKNAINLAAKLSVKELGALLQDAACVVTGDTGPLHIASAVRAPIVCLSGAADPDRTGPTAARDLVVIRRDLPCVPCQDRRCRRGDIACMNGLPVEWVTDAVLRRLNDR